METASRHRRLVNKRLLLALSVLFGLAGIGLLFIAFFDLHPHVNYVSRRYGFLDYKQGIPVAANTNLKIADTSIMTYYKDGWSLVTIPRDFRDERKSIPDKLPMPEKSDSIFAHKTVYDLRGEVDKHVTVNEIQLNRAKFYLQTEKLSYRLYFASPGILNCLVASYCFWLLALLIPDIQEGWSFGKTNRLRLQQVGWAVLTLQAVYFILELFPPLLINFDISFITTIPGEPSHFDFQADPEKPFSITWTLIGALILVLASAFRDGEMLQEDKDLIV